MAQFLRPDADVATSSWAGTPTGSPNIYQNVDETTASDTDFAYSGNNPNGSGCELGLSNPTNTPASGTCTVRWRQARLNGTTLSGTGTAVSLDVQVLQGASVIASSGAATLSGSWVAGSFTFNTSLVTDWTDLRVNFVATGGGGSPANRRGAGVSWFEIETPDGAVADDLLADDIQLLTEVSSPAIGQGHVLNANDIQSTTEVSGPALVAGYPLRDDTDANLFDDIGFTLFGTNQAVATDALFANDVESATEVSAPALGQVHDLLAEDVEAATQVTSPAIGQGHALLADDVQSATEVSLPTIGQVHSLLAEDIESATEVSAPVLQSVSGTDNLLADDVEAATEVSGPALVAGYELRDDQATLLFDDVGFTLFGTNFSTGVDVLLANDIEAATEVSAPTLSNIGLSLVIDTGPDPDAANFTVTVSDTGTLFWVVSTATPLTGPQVEAGGGQASGSIAAPGGSGSGTIDMNAVPTGTWTLHAVYKRTSDGAYSNVVTEEITLDNTREMTATSIESATEVSAPSIGQVHVLLAEDIESATEVSAPAVGQVHVLLADDVESSTEVSAPVLQDVGGGTDALLAEDVQSLTEVSAPTLGQVHTLFADDVEAAAEVSAPTLGQVHILTAEDIQALTQVSNPSLTSVAGQDNLLADDVEAATEVTAPTLGQVHVLNASDIEAATEVAVANLGQIHVLAANDIEALTQVSTPSMTNYSAFKNARRKHKLVVYRGRL